ncbi:MAG: hypothetical protein K2R98_18955 [Gemmataceae bacterium]|nr:hypothetical protein [Gemmataceae bacterium]
MTEETWAELESRAQRVLEHPKDLEPREPIRRYGSFLRLWRFPAVGVQTTWTILLPGKKALPNSVPMVREVAWDQEADRNRIFDPVAVRSSSQPTIRLRDAALASDLLTSRLAIGGDLAVPLLGISCPIGVDGEFFGLETYEVSPFVRTQWWCDGPVEWRHLIDWVGELRSFLLRSLDQTG